MRNLKYGVTPLFTPEKAQINEHLKRHSVWIHSGHGGAADGILVAVKNGGQYRPAFFKASDIADTGLEYDLVFMNTCESTDRKFIPVIPITPQSVGGWAEDMNFVSHAVMDIGTTLNAKNYIGWDCEIKRQLSVQIPEMLVQALDTTAAGETRTVNEAVQEVSDTLDRTRLDFWWYNERLRVTTYDMTTFDLNKKQL